MFCKPWSLTTLAALTLGAAPLLAQATDWPGERPVRVVVPSSAGGSADTLVRPLAQAMSEVSGSNFIVENRGGAAGMIGADNVAKSAPDGYSMLVGAVHHAIMPVVYNVPYDTATDLRPIALISTVPNVVLVHKDAPYQTLEELIAYAKANPGELNYGTGGKGTLHHLTTEAFKKATGIQMEAVHYKGSGPAINDLLGQQIQLMFETMPSALGQIRGGTLRAVAVTSPERSFALPDVPTLAESGVPDLAVTTWYGFFAPGKLPDDIAEKMRQVTLDALATEKIQALWKDYGATTDGDGSEDFQAFVTSELERWKTIAQEAGLSTES
ncbi:MAG: Bug family tripartite tricarboxylate transporter substrate binding protein [Pigmentiphaga sp.]